MSVPFYFPFVEAYTKVFTSVGLNSAFKVGVATAVLTAAGLWILKPSGTFDEEGNPKPWIFLSDPASRREPVYLPWYVRAALVGYTVNLIV